MALRAAFGAAGNLAEKLANRLPAVVAQVAYG
jgi:hypothetical protein